MPAAIRQHPVIAAILTIILVLAVVYVGYRAWFAWTMQHSSLQAPLHAL